MCDTNRNFRRRARKCIAALLIIFIMAVSPLTVFAEGWDLSLPSLAESYEEFFLFGNIWSNHGQMGDETTVDKYLHHYSTITASNLHKVDAVLGAAPNAWEWNWDTADYIVNFADENNLAMVWHTLAWHNQSRAWLTNVPGTMEPLTRAEAIENMHQFISTVAGRYSGRIFSYDVVNEVIYAGNWARNPDWRVHLRRTGQGLPDDNVNITRWYDAFANGADESLGECGSDYVYYAFRFARIYDPFAILYYNDYNEFERNKRDAIAHMVEDINERWRDDPLYDGRLLIEGIGMQSHYNLRNWPSSVSPVRVALERFIETGARVSITELNVYLEGGGIVPSDENLPELFVEQATRYRELFELYLEFSDHIERVTFFIWQDLPAQQGAWRRWPHSQHPALFDLERNAKPAFHAVLEALDNAAVPNISVPFVTQNFTQQTTGSDRFILGLNATQNNFAPIRWRIVEGELPEGLYLHPVTGVIMGVFANPTANPDRYYTFTVAAENAAGYGTREFTINQSNMSIDWWSSEYPHAPPPIAEPPTENSAYNAENDTENDTENGTENNTAELLADADPQPMEDEPSEDEIAPATDAETSDNRAVMFIAVLVVGGVAFYVFKKARQARN